MIRPIIPWMGGKRRLSKHILPEIEGFRTYVEPFCGGASMFFLKDPSKVEVINDLNGDLINLYRVVQSHLDEFVRFFRWVLVSREWFDIHKKSTPESLTDIQRAVRFYYLMKVGFGGKGGHFGTSKTAPPKLNLLRIEEDLSNAHLRLARAVVENKSWFDVVKQYDSPETCFYLDPPYHETTGYGVEFEYQHYDQMAAFMRETSSKVVVSINDHPDIRETFKGLKYKEIFINYSVGLSNSTKASELLITNR